ncbi:hypothetical protein U0L90_06280 [Flavobacteriaceae sp. LMIT009]
MTTTNEKGFIFSWIMGGFFVIIGVLNILLVDVVPGLFYLVLALLLIPITNYWLKKTVGFTIPFSVKVIAFIIIMWATLGVGDLAEILGL